MLVKDLIRALRKLDPEMPVVFRHDPDTPFKDGLPRYEAATVKDVDWYVEVRHVQEVYPIDGRAYQYRTIGTWRDRDFFSPTTKVFALGNKR